jgi:hypothetical protein
MLFTTHYWNYGRWTALVLLMLSLLLAACGVGGEEAADAPQKEQGSAAEVISLGC